MQACASSRVETFTVINPDTEWRIADVPDRPAGPDEAGRAVKVVVRLLDTLQKACGSAPALKSSYRLEIVNAGAINAFYRDGTVRLTRGMLGYARSAPEIAFVIAHELAHEVLDHDHRDGLTRRAKETAADSLAAEIVAATGYERARAVDVLRRMAADFPDAHHGTAYPSYAGRLRRLDAGVDGKRDGAPRPAGPGVCAAQLRRG